MNDSDRTNFTSGPNGTYAHSEADNQQQGPRFFQEPRQSWGYCGSQGRPQQMGWYQRAPWEQPGAPMNGFQQQWHQATANPFRQKENLLATITPILQILQNMLATKHYLHNTSAAEMVDIAMNRMPSPLLGINQTPMDLQDIKGQLELYRKELAGLAATEELVSYVENAISQNEVRSERQRAHDEFMEREIYTNPMRNTVRNHAEQETSRDS